ncbi:MAG: bi-domain-containing oxidoreductase [Gemmatimonadetes bacterium]|nr:bi-domain-containing oxidoreductase [Gemmatimonadota bacterium]
MRQIVRRVIDRKGKVVVLELPEPHLGADQVLVQSHHTLISSGTEMTTLAKTPAELVRQTIADPWMRKAVQQTVLSAGLAQTARRVWQELIKPREIGYSGSGRVLAVGEGAEGFRVGDKVAYAATGHAEIVAPTVNHIVAVPEEIDSRHAAFVTVGGIAIQSLRRAEIKFGEVIAVFGLGLVGQLCARIAKAAGCVVVGIDVDDTRNDAAVRGGADFTINPATSDLKRKIMDFTGKQGVDSTIICAASTSETIINSSMEITRKQGKVVIVGYVNLNIHPKNFLYREIDLRYSRAYGPGSYHGAYERGRIDYPFSYVRWTEKRNLQEFIRLVGAGAIQLEPLIGGAYAVERAQEAFDAIREGTLGGIAALIEYDVEREPDRRRTIELHPRPKASGTVGISIIGLGNHVLATHLPNLRALRGVEVRALASATGKNASLVGKSVDATVVTTDVDELLQDPDTDGVIIASTQPEHFEHVRKAIDAQKPMFVEKPLVTLVEDFATILRAMESEPILLTLGLNRRYSPLVTKLRESLQGPADSVTYTIAEQFIPPDHWSLDEFAGGGRLVSEGEHFIDLCHFLIGREPTSVYARPLGTAPDDPRKLCNFALTIHYDGAVAHVVFNESAGAGFPRERVQAMASGTVAVLDDFSKLVVHGKKQRSYGGGRGRQMGHREAMQAFVAALRGDPSDLLRWREAQMATLCMFAGQESIRTGEPVDVRQFHRSLLAGDAE